MKAILVILAVVLCAGFGYAYSSGEPIPAVTVRSHEAKSLNLNRNYSAIHVPCSKHI